MKGFWFSNADKRLRHNDGRLAEVGVTHTVDGELEICEHGLHGSLKLVDALTYAPGDVIWLCEFDGDIIEGKDKIVARSRTYLVEFDAKELLKEFARKCALRVIHLAKSYFKTSKDYELVVEFLKTGKNADAAYAAIDVARIVTNAAVAAAAAYAARSARAAAAVAYANTDAVAVTAAACAAHSAGAYGEEREWQNETLTQMVCEATGWEI